MNVPSAEIHHRLQQQYGEESLPWTLVFEWCKCFREGRERVERSLRTPPSSRLLSSCYAANHKPLLIRASRCFQNIGKIVMTPEGEYVED
jgi:hypothetical protein